MTFKINERLEQIDGCFESVGNSHPESPLIINHSDDEFRKALGTSKRQGPVAVPAHYAYQTETTDAAGHAIVGEHINYEFQNKRVAHKPIQHDFSDGFLASFLNPYLHYKPIKYKMAKTIKNSDGFVHNGTLWMPNHSGGATPPTPPNILGPDGTYYQIQNIKTPVPSKTFLSEMIKGAKKGLYQGITEFPVFVRDGGVRWLSKKSWVLDLLTSLYQMGADVGPVQRMRTDFLHDTLELIVNESSELLALRIYNDKKYTPFVNWILEGESIPYHGRPAEKDDLSYTPGGLIVYKKTCGGEPLTYTAVPSDQAYHALGTLKWITHGEVLKPGLDTSQLWKNLNEFTISYYINDRKDLWVPLQKHTETGEQISRITLPKGWSPSAWDYRLMKKTVYYSVGGAALLHVPFWGGEKMYGFLGLDPSLIEGRELSAMFIPDKRLISRGM